MIKKNTRNLTYYDNYDVKLAYWGAGSISKIEIFFSFPLCWMGHALQSYEEVHDPAHFALLSVLKRLISTSNTQLGTDRLRPVEYVRRGPSGLQMVGATVLNHWRLPRRQLKKTPFVKRYGLCNMFCLFDSEWCHPVCFTLLWLI